MSRLIFIVIVIVLAYLLFKAYRKKLPRQDEPAKEQDMISCATCGIHVPKSESLQVDGKYYCCSEHSQGGTDKQAGK